MKKPNVTKISFSNINDLAAKIDMLGFEPYVRAVADFLTNENTTPPLTMSIEGEWGSGKSSFILQLGKKIEDKGGKTVYFNAWRHDKAEALWATFVSDFISQLSKKTSLEGRIRGYCGLLRLRLDLKKGAFEIFRFFIFLFSSVIIITMVVLFLSQYSFSIENLFKVISDALNEKTLLTSLIGITASLGIIISFRDTIRNFFDTSMEVDFNKCLTSPNYEIHMEFIQKFHHDFANIVSAYSNDSRVYIFIDDLDRCDIPKAAELMHAINMLIDDNPNLIFIIGMDRTKIAAGIASQNEKLIPYLYPTDYSTEFIDNNLSLKGLEYGFEFIEKFIQIPFLVPQPNENDINNFLEKINSYLSNKKDGSMPKQLIEDNHNEIYGESNGTLNEEFKDLFAWEKIETGKEDNSFTELITMASSALDNNPRRLKQFINLLRLKLYISMETGLFVCNKMSTIENRWNTKKLAKFVAISIKWPLLITHLASNKSLLHNLQKIALSQTSVINGSRDDPKLLYWSEQTKLIELLKYGCFDDDESFKSEESKIYSLDGLNFDKLLIVSPVVKLSVNEDEFSNSEYEFGDKVTIRNSFLTQSNINILPKVEGINDSTVQKTLDIIQGNKEGVFQNEIWKTLGIDSRQCSRVVSKLVDGGLITREPAISNGARSYLLKIKDIDQ